MLHSRIKRVEELVHHTLAELLLTEIKDPRLNAANVTHVKVSKDLSSALVAVSCLDSTPGAAEDMLAGLDKAKGWLRKELGARVRLKFIPDLKFIHDTSAAYAAHIQDILHKVIVQPEPVKDERDAE